MAGIDKIYCDNYKDFEMFWNWCEKFDYLFQKETHLSLLWGFYCKSKEEFLEWFGKDGYKPYGYPITNFSETHNLWLIKHCPIEFVRKRLLEQYKSYKIKNKEIELYIDKS